MSSEELFQRAFGDPYTSTVDQKISQEINEGIKVYGKSERYWNPDDPNDPFNGAINLTDGNIPYDY